MTTTNENYVYLKCTGSGDTFAARLDDNSVVIACCGPLYYMDVTEANLPDFDYSSEDAEWLEENTDRLVEAPYAGDIHTAEMAEAV